MLHLDLLERQFSQHLIFRLRVRLSLKVRLKSDPDRESRLPGIAVDEDGNENCQDERIGFKVENPRWRSERTRWNLID